MYVSALRAKSYEIELNKSPPIGYTRDKNETPLSTELFIQVLIVAISYEQVKVERT